MRFRPTEFCASDGEIPFLESFRAPENAQQRSGRRSRQNVGIRQVGKLRSLGGRRSYTFESDSFRVLTPFPFRSNNGIMVLLSLLSTKTPVTDADLIRSLACRALVGLSRHGESLKKW